MIINNLRNYREEPAFNFDIFTEEVSGIQYHQSQEIRRSSLRIGLPIWYEDIHRIGKV